MQDYILIWNEVALEAARVVSHTDKSKAQQNGPTLSSRALAIVHLAMYDAYAGVTNDSTNLPPYLTPGSAPQARRLKPPWRQQRIQPSCTYTTNNRNF